MTFDPSILDWTLGELDPDELDAVRRRLQREAPAALEAADVRTLLEDMRSLTVEPTGRVETAVRYAAARRLRLRRPGGQGADGVGRLRSWSSLRSLTRVAAVAAITFCGLSWSASQKEQSDAVGVAGVAESSLPAWRPSIAPTFHAPTSTASPEGHSSGVLEDVLTAGGANLKRHYRALQKLAEVDMFTGQVRANNELAMLRLEFTQRYSRRARRASIALCGGKPNLEDRIQALASSVAGTIQGQLARGEATVEGAALALRALLAGGSTLRIGHREAVASSVAFLEERIDQLDGGQLASALAALTDFAVVTGGRAASIVAVHGQRLADAAHSLPVARAAHSSDESSGIERRRPALLGFSTPVACLADAGHVLQLAPAFGVHPMQAHEARLLMAAHLEERLDESHGERPEILAAMLYGFGDLVDREQLDHRLLLWRPALLGGHDLVALHHVSWSQFPPRPGWATFQRELREMATVKTPPGVRDASALLLSLAMNYAAPGVHGVLRLAG